MRCWTHLILSRVLLARFASVARAPTLEKSIRPCLIVKVLIKFIEVTAYYTMINYSFTFQTKVFWLLLQNYTQVQIYKSSLIKLYCILFCAAFKSHTEWSNTQRASAPTTMTQTNSDDNCHCLNCFGPMLDIYPGWIWHKVFFIVEI